MQPSMLLKLLNQSCAIKQASPFIFRSIATSSVRMAKVGDKIPDCDLYENSPGNKINTSQLCAGKQVIFFAVPGAFTPLCSKTHFPSYLQNADTLKSQGVDEIVCVAVNDPFVLAAWQKDMKAEGKIRVLADPQAQFTKKMDLSIDLPPLGGVRSKRYSMTVKDGVIQELNVEPDGTGLTCSLADHFVKK